MQKVDIRFAGSIENAARALVNSAPARGDYWGVPLRARYATTRPADVVAYYERIIQERAHAYGAQIPKAMRDRMRCDTCGATGCKLWREYQTCADYTDLFCGACALLSQKKEGPIDAGGYRQTEYGRCDQIGWLLPAVPTHDGTFWGYTSVPTEGVKWWRDLPTVART